MTFSAFQFGHNGWYVCGTDSCYMALPSSTWHDGASLCKTVAYGGHFAEITDQTEYDLVQSLIGTGMFICCVTIPSTHTDIRAIEASSFYGTCTMDKLHSVANLGW